MPRTSTSNIRSQLKWGVMHHLTIKMLHFVTKLIHFEINASFFSKSLHKKPEAFC